MSEITIEYLHAHRLHPGFEYEVTEGGRKCFYNSEEPPPGEGWVRNVEEGRDGWERFDFHEESYWRRRVNQTTDEQAIEIVGQNKKSAENAEIIHWRPIAEAKKDGTRYLLSSRDRSFVTHFAEVKGPRS